MDTTVIPFNQHVGLEAAPPESGFLLALPDHGRYANHLGTVHAGALLTLAEAASGEFLARRFPDPGQVVPVVRRLEAKFRRPGGGRLQARARVTEQQVAAWGEQLRARGRLSLSLPMEVVDAGGEVVMSALVEWFITRK